MAPNPDKNKFLEQDNVTKDLNRETNTKGRNMSILLKLALNAACLGSEASNGFEHLYTVPILQTLGLPMRLASLTGAVAGPTAFSLLPLLGWLTDQGSNPVRRKMMAAIFACGLVFMGMLCIIMANIFHFNYLLEISANNSAHAPLPSDLSDPFKNSPLDSSDWDDDATTVGQRTATKGPVSRATDSTDSLAILGVPDVYAENDEIPFKAGLGLLGFILLDIGFDASSSCVKSFVLTCGPRSEHSSLLIIGLVIASAGGVSTTSLALVDFGSMFGLSYIEGARLTIQSTVQAVVVTIFTIVGLSISLLTVHRMLKLHSSSAEDAVVIPKPQNSLVHEAKPHHEETLSRSVILDALENSFRSLGAGSIHFDQSMAIRGEHQRSQSLDHRIYHRSTERTPLLEDERGVMEESEQERSWIASASVSYERTDSLSSIPDHLEARTTTMKDVPERRESKQTLEDTPELAVPEIQSRCCERGFKTKVFLIFLTTYFSFSVITMIALTSSDFVGKAIYGGDPAALPGSQSLISYQEGVRMSSIGFFIHYIFFFIGSIFQSRVLALIGYRAEFAIVHLVILALITATSVTERLEVYFLMTVAAGFHRAVIYSVPYAVANDLFQSKAAETENGKSHVGLAMSMIVAAAPLSYCTLFSWVGSLEELTGVVAVPFWVACVNTFLATCMFLAVGKV
ncbi:uncharacterized protein LOC143298931 [Babylonia areolata]|uniref:uncharacterized protein LOC143298931 n=1 Tax=Babylonia areolata TaxID=304850 RepID=UPI003FD5E2E6